MTESLRIWEQMLEAEIVLVVLSVPRKSLAGFWKHQQSGPKICHAWELLGR